MLQGRRLPGRTLLGRMLPGRMLLGRMLLGKRMLGKHHQGMKSGQWIVQQLMMEQYEAAGVQSEMGGLESRKQTGNQLCKYI